MDIEDINWGTNKIVDKSGNGSSGTLIGLTQGTSQGVGKIGQSLKFDGIGNYVFLNDLASIRTARNYVTISGWFMFENVSSGSQSCPFWFSGSTPANYFRAGWSSTSIGGHIWDGTSVPLMSVTVPTLVNQRWYHIVSVYDLSATDSVSMRVYINGNYIGIDTKSLDTSKFNNFIYGRLGYSVSGVTNRYFKGSIDDFRIYNRALSAQEISNIYTTGGLSKISASASSIVSTSTAVGLDAGLVGWWTMDGQDINWTTNKIIDRSGNGNIGTLVNLSTTTSTISGKIGQSLQFLSSTLIKAPSLDAYPNGKTSLTMSVWAKWNGSDNATGSADKSIVGWWYNNDNRITVPRSSPGRVQLKILANGTAVVNSARSDYNDNKWHHIVGIYDGAKTYLYIDGNQASTPSNMTGPMVSSDKFNIGSINNDGSGSWNFRGSVDDTRIYSRALSPSEVRDLYNQGGTKLSASSPTIVSPTTATGLNRGLVGYWTMDGKDINWTTNKIIDRSGYGNAGTLVALGTTTAPAMGKVGQGLRFDGVNSFIGGVGDFYDLRANNQTVSVWFKGSTLSQPGEIVSKSRYGAATGRWSLAISSAGLVSVFMNCGGSDIDSSGTNTKVVTDNKWHNIVGVWNRAGNFETYIDGMSDGVVSISSCNGVDMNTAYHFLIGTYGDVTGLGGIKTTLSLKGLLDEVRIYNRALSSTEIKQLYNLGK